VDRATREKEPASPQRATGRPRSPALLSAVSEDDSTDRSIPPEYGQVRVTHFCPRSMNLRGTGLHLPVLLRQMVSLYGIESEVREEVTQIKYRTRKVKNLILWVIFVIVTVVVIILQKSPAETFEIINSLDATMLRQEFDWNLSKFAKTFYDIEQMVVFKADSG
jgi:hypothetical protein